MLPQGTCHAVPSCQGTQAAPPQGAHKSFKVLARIQHSLPLPYHPSKKTQECISNQLTYDVNQLTYDVNLAKFLDSKTVGGVFPNKGLTLSRNH